MIHAAKVQAVGGVRTLVWVRDGAARAGGERCGVSFQVTAQAANVDVGFRTAAWFWNQKGLNGPAARGEIDTVSRGVNGGNNGLQERRDYYRSALNVLRR